MKNKILILLIVVILITSLALIIKKKSDPISLKENQEKRAVFISYLEFNKYLKNQNKENITKQINNIINNVSKNKFNMIILQVRPFGDAIYESKYFYPSLTIVSSEEKELPIDVLKTFIDYSHEKGIEVHAWINPFRIRSNDNSSTIKNPLFLKWLQTNNILINKGIYLNPASKEVRELIVNGVREIVTNYNVDGIHYDDYFYPNEIIDLKNYEQYKQEGGTLSLTEYRYDNINLLLKETYKTIKQVNKDVLFGISPSGNIENNLTIEYLNIKAILQENNYIDYVMPQIYFGFNNSNKPYIETLYNWDSLIINNNIKLYVALALYKSNQIDNWANEGKYEWQEYNDILKRQVIIARNLDKYEGLAVFRYDNMLNETSKKEIDNLLSIF